jgi:hypothetical protein
MNEKPLPGDLYRVKDEYLCLKKIDDIMTFLVVSSSSSAGNWFKLCILSNKGLITDFHRMNDVFYKQKYDDRCISKFTN